MDSENSSAMTRAKRTCVFHHPYPVKPGGKSGSRVRPFKMINALEAIGYRVLPVTGYVSDRREGIRSVMRYLEDGGHIDFVYAENQTMPTALTEPHHMPTAPWMDFRFLKALRGRGIPVGLFYRDLYWRFKDQSFKNPLKRVYTDIFFHLEWQQYQQAVEHLFLPDLAMVPHLPSPFRGEISALPPGAEPSSSLGARPASQDPSAPVRLFYVGGVRPPYYELTPLFEWAGGQEGLTLQVCCRKEEWQAMKGYYPVGPNTEIVHASGPELERLYSQADVLAILWRPATYSSITVPVKLYEALGHATPILTSAGTPTAVFVEEEGLGWVVSSQDEFDSVIRRLRHDPSELEAVRARMREVLPSHTWQARAQQVADRLTRSGARGTAE